MREFKQRIQIKLPNKQNQFRPHTKLAMRKVMVIEIHVQLVGLQSYGCILELHGDVE